MNNPHMYTDPLGLWEVRYEAVYKEKKNKDGTVTTVFDHYVAKAYKTKGDADTPAELARQLGLKGKEAENFAADLAKKGVSDGITMSKLGGSIGRVYGFVQDLLTDQRKYDDKNGNSGGGPGDANYADCSSTAANLFSAFAGANGQNWSVKKMDEFIEQNHLSSKSADELRVGDIVRYGSDVTNDKGEVVTRNAPKHFTTFIFMNDKGDPVVFSRSGDGGPFEHGSASSSKFVNSTYGTIRGIRKDDTGFYGK